MDVDLETFLLLEKRKLKEEKERLSARSAPAPSVSSHNEEECPALRVLQNMDRINDMKCNRAGKGTVEKCNFLQGAAEAQTNDGKDFKEEIFLCEADGAKGLSTSTSSTQRSAVNAEVKTESSMTTAAAQMAQQKSSTQTPRDVRPPSNSVDFYDKFSKDINVARASRDKESELQGQDVNGKQALSKTQKDLANHKEAVAPAEAASTGNRKSLSNKKKDDMEQWVSDTFYSYFPGFNNEYQKRQNHLRDRQLENQQNFLKHQMSQPPPAQGTTAGRKTRGSNGEQPGQPAAPATARSSNTSSTDKTDLEIIVNNPHYEPPRHARPGTTRHRLLQDLRHTELSNIITGDGVPERNRRSAEIELARKKDYQRELVQQIEEKRRSIEMLREKERRQEEALTRRLQEQLQTIKLEEELEKEKIRAEKIRFDTEQNRVMREHLLAKLENDSKLLLHSNKAKKDQGSTKPADTSAKSSADSQSHDHGENKVYKYFSNSARHEYRRGKPLPADVELDLELPESLATPHTNTERECFHLSEKVCPMCDAPLKSYESCCLRCQRKLSLKIRTPRAEGGAAEAKGNGSGNGNGNGNGSDEEDSGGGGGSSGRSYSLVCSKCERLYTLCPTCLEKSDVCRACHRKRNVCMNCRRTLCSFCLEEIACGRDAETSHVNERFDGDEKKKVSPGKNDSGGSERSFQVLEVNYASGKTVDDDDGDNEVGSPPLPANNINYYNNNLSLPKDRPPYSMNIDRNSIFHSSYEPKKQLSFEPLPKIMDKSFSFDLDSSAHTDENSNIERVRRETDRRLSRYLKNYGDLAKHTNSRSQSESRNRSTQTTPVGSGRRDVVLHEGNNLSMPLLREMPKMTRKETTQLLADESTSGRRMIENLSRRWEIPAVQKYSISPTSPPVLTQVGAIRKQLQADRLMAGDF